MNILGNRLKLIREKKGMKTKELADMINVTPATIANWESGRRAPKTDDLLEIANILDVSLDYLMGRTNNEQISIYESEYEDLPLKIEVDKNYLSKLTPSYVSNLLHSLEESGFDINKLLDAKKKEEL